MSNGAPSAYRTLVSKRLYRCSSCSKLHRIHKLQWSRCVKCSEELLELAEEFQLKLAGQEQVEEGEK